MKMWSSECKKTVMWGKSFVRPAVGLGQFWTILYSGCKKNKMWGRNCGNIQNYPGVTLELGSRETLTQINWKTT
jgi:hypothetical protein